MGKEFRWQKKRHGSWHSGEANMNATSAEVRSHPKKERKEKEKTRKDYPL